MSDENNKQTTAGNVETSSTNVKDDIANNHNELVDSETNKNKKKIKCIRCDSCILQPMSGTYKKLDASLKIPTMKQKKEIVNNPDSIEHEPVDAFWLVEEMFTFDNIGFTNTVDNKKYLICADCEIGPVGVQNIDKPNEFLLCMNRVKYV